MPVSASPQNDFFGSPTEQGSQVGPSGIRGTSEYDVPLRYAFPSSQEQGSVADYINSYVFYLESVRQEELADMALEQPERHVFGAEADIFQHLADIQVEADQIISELRESEDEDVRRILDEGLRTHLESMNPQATADQIEMWLEQGDYRGASATTAMDALSTVLGVLEGTVSSLNLPVDKYSEEGKSLAEAQARLLELGKLLEEPSAQFESGPLTDEAKSLLASRIMGLQSESRMERATLLAEFKGLQASQKDYIQNLKTSSTLGPLLGDLREQFGNLQQAQVLYQGYVEDAITSVFTDTGLSKLGSRLDVYFGRGMSGYEQEFAEMGTWGWKDLAIQELYSKGDQAVSEGVYGQVINLSNSTIRQFLDVTLNFPEVRNALGEQGIMEVLGAIDVDRYTANNMTAYVMERIGNAYGARLAEMANQNNVDLLSLYFSGASQENAKALQNARAQSDMEKDLGIEADVPRADWYDIRASFIDKVNHAFWGNFPDTTLKGPLLTPVISSGGAARRGPFPSVLPWQQGDGLVPAIEGLFGKLQDPRVDIVEPRKDEEKEDDDFSKSRQSNRRLQFPVWEYRRRRY